VHGEWREWPGGEGQHGARRVVRRKHAHHAGAVAHAHAAHASRLAPHRRHLRFLDAHHGGEDALIWPLLSDRCAEARTLIASMEAQHDHIHSLREECGAALESWQASPTRDRAASLVGSLGALREELERHFVQEEVEILPLASANMSPEEWGALPGHAMAHFTVIHIRLFTGGKLPSWL